MGRWALRLLVLAYLFFLVGWPVYLVGRNAFARGFTDFQAILADPYTVYALELTLWVAIASVAINTVFGVGISLLIVRYRFRGKRLLTALEIDPETFQRMAVAAESDDALVAQVRGASPTIKAGTFNYTLKRPQ